MRKVVFIFWLFFLLVSCDSALEFNINQSDIVVEGWIEADGYPVIIVTETFPISNRYENVENLKQFIVKWAKVTVISETDSVVLTGKYDNGYFPPYVYTTSRIKGEVGKSYTLKVEYKDYNVTAKTTIPEFPEITSFNLHKCDGVDSLYIVDANFSGNFSETNCYQCFSRVGAKWRQYFASFMGSLNGHNLSYSSTIPIYRSRHLLEDDYTPYYKYNDTISVKVSQLDSVSYNFWHEYMKTQVTSLNTFFSFQENLSSNINGGIGYWCGYASRRAYFVVKSDTTILLND